MQKKDYKISIIIPARNEENNIDNILMHNPLHLDTVIPSFGQRYVHSDKLNFYL